MFLIKNICLIMFSIIFILFTVGYASQPIIVSNNNALSLLDFNSIKHTYSDNNYNSIIDNVNLAYTSVYYSCILISILLGLGIIFVLFKYYIFKVTGNILFLISLIYMIVVFIVLQLLIILNSFVTSFDQSSDSKSIQFNIQTSNGTGYYLMLVSTILMIITHIVYTIFA